jgi:hypothetical protein
LILFIDGIIIAYSNVVDCGGTDIVSNTYHVHLTPITRNRFIVLHEYSFDIGIIVLTPILGTAGMDLNIYTVSQH